MKPHLQRLSRTLLQAVRTLEGYRDLVLAWLNGIAARLFPTPVKVPAKGARPSRSR